MALRTFRTALRASWADSRIPGFFFCAGFEWIPLSAESPVTFDEYQTAAARTMNATLSGDQRLLDAAAGIAEEAGEAGGSGEGEEDVVVLAL